MDNPEILSCFNDVKEAFLNTQLTEELYLLTPRDIRNTIENWATVSTDKERVEELIFEWLEQDGYSNKKDKLSPAEKHRRLLLTVSNAEKYLDSILTKRDKSIEEAERKKFNSLTPEEQTEYLNTIPLSVKGEDHGKCNIEEYRNNMECLLNMAIPTDQNRETRLLKLLKDMRYDFSDEVNGYPFFLSFLSELIRYEFILCREIIPYKKELENIIRRVSLDDVDTIMQKRLNYYREIGVRKKHIHLATLNSTKWAIPFNDFAKLYRKILGLKKRALLTPLT